MRKTHIIGIVWGAVVVFLVSFGATVFFLDDDLNKNNSESLKEDSYVSSNYAYIMDESSIRTNELASLEKSKNPEKTKEKINDKIISDDEIDFSVDIEDTVEIINKNMISFIKPVKGEILNNFSTDELIYSKTLQEWKVHNGIDYKSYLGSEVYATANGKVKEIKFDYEYGKRLIIEHENGYESNYSNITVLDEIKIGDMVKQGQIVGYVAESFGFEVAEETHLHFELKKDGKYISI